MNQYNDLIHELALQCGIVGEYWDALGQWREASVETKRTILSAMGLSVGSEEELHRAIRERKERNWKRFIAPVTIISINSQPFSVPVTIAVEEEEEGSLRFSWMIRDEKGQELFSAPDCSWEVSDNKWIEGRRYLRIEIPCSNPDAPPYPIGYYTFEVTCARKGAPLSGKTRLIITPDSCYLPPCFENQRLWGLSVNLYSMQSARNCGIGDLGDLAQIMRWVAGLGGGFVGINPLHCIENRAPFGISPYSPLSRLYRNFIYLDLKAIPDVAESSDARILMESESFREQLKELRQEEFISYEGVAQLKQKVLRQAFKHFHDAHLLPGTPRGQDFSSYVNQEGSALETYAAFMTLSSRLGMDWTLWPEEYRTPAGEATKRLGQEERKELFFYMYIQWLIDRQLRDISKDAAAGGMAIGIYNDLALGSVPGGSDAWMAQEIFAGNIDVGAPPDDFCREGQNWGFPPLIPDNLRESGYDYLVQTLRKNMQHGGAIRIDHALGIFRLFWIPKGAPASEGAYVTYPSEEILRIIALESVRNKTVIIGEDLGTIGDNVREALSRFRMLSYRLLYFERNYPDPAFTSPERYPEMALCSVTTHDLPTLYGYWKGRDIELREKMGLYSDRNAMEHDEAIRARDKALLIAALRSEGILREDAPSLPEMDPALCAAVYAYLSRSHCKLLALSLDDAICTLDQQNLPGQTDSYPSWMQKTPLSLEQITTDPWIPSLVTAIRSTGRSAEKKQT
ncbi:MAG: 4-alpha-glucanotransferase [Nitrospirales bacterium]|nr:4-alpha-glucanotransferase [Nitrospirales bacterium]